MITLSKSAVLFDREGYQQESGLTVIDQGDIVIVGQTTHRKEDIDIIGNRIVSRHGWFLLLDIPAITDNARKGGQSRSQRKSTAAKLNGTKGGRPRKP